MTFLIIDAVDTELRRAAPAAPFDATSARASRARSNPGGSHEHHLDDNPIERETAGTYQGGTGEGDAPPVDPVSATRLRESKGEGA